MIDLRQAARALGGDIVGRDQVLCPGPGHSPRDRSLAVRFVADGFIVHSHANDDWQTCRDYVSARLGWDTQRPVMKPAPMRATPQPTDDTVDRIGWARSLWRATIPARGTLAEKYLVETRRLELPDSAAIRFHPRLKFSRIGEFLPAMVCAMVDIRTNEFTGIHRTFLTADTKKAGVLTLGRKLGSAIKIDPDDVVHEGLAVAEGVESAIAARFIYRPAWSLIDANGVNGLPRPPCRFWHRCVLRLLVRRGLQGAGHGVPPTTEHRSRCRGAVLSRPAAPRPGEGSSGPHCLDPRADRRYQPRLCHA